MYKEYLESVNNSLIRFTEDKKKELSKLLDNEFQSKKHKLNESDKNSVREASSVGKLESNVVKPLPINKQTMKIVDYKKGVIYIK